MVLSAMFLPSFSVNSSREGKVVHGRSKSGQEGKYTGFHGEKIKQVVDIKAQGDTY